MGPGLLSHRRLDQGKAPDSEQPISSLVSSQWDGLEGELCPIRMSEVWAGSFSCEFEPEIWRVWGTIPRGIRRRKSH